MISKNQRMHPGLAILLLLMLGLVFCSTAYGVLGQKTATPKTNVKDLPLVGSYENLKKLLENSRQNSMRVYATADTAVAGAVPQAKNIQMESATRMDYSGTNVQVQGVDEGDLVKNDGQYIYQVNKNRILIISAVPADQMRLVNTIQFSDTGFTPIDLYLDGDQLIVVGNSSLNKPVYKENASQLKAMPSYYHNFSICRAVVYNIKDKNHISQLRRLELEGNYLSSRKVGSSFYLLSNRYIDYYTLEQGQNLTPLYRDTVKADQLVAQDIKKIKYFPGCINPNYLVIGSMDLKNANQAADINSYLGSGDNIYASTQNLYVAVNEYNYANGNTPLAEKSLIAPAPATSATKLYKFGLEAARLVYKGEGQVPGTILNQFSMDEYGNYFRIATTSGEVWRSDANTSKNNVYILDQDLKVKGKIEDIAPGEKIYSTRFMGSRAYMVTFKKVDPFFVLDLKDPAQPKILGKLKIPGYSDYLHPYDENHIIGFGKDTVEASGYNGQSMAFYQGMKIAIFDVSDVTKPVEMSKVIIGDRGTDSELLRNHKALLFSREKNLLAFPVTVMTLDKDQSSSGGNIPAYGSFSFQGVYVYNIDLKQGLQLKGKISHLDKADYLKAGEYWDDPDKSIDRILYIGNHLYTLSPAMIKANQMSDLKDIQTLPLN